MEKTGRVWSAKEKNRAPQLAIRLVIALFITSRAPSGDAAILSPAGLFPKFGLCSLSLIAVIKVFTVGGQFSHRSCLSG